MNEEQYIESMFKDAGWFAGRRVDVSSKATAETEKTSPALRNALTVLSEFGSLSVGETGSGREIATSDIAFKNQPLDFGSEFHNYWKTLNSSLYAVATAHRDHIFLIVDDRNIFYVFTDPDEELYEIGTFKEAVKRLLLGLEYGTPLEKA